MSSIKSEAKTCATSPQFLRSSYFVYHSSTLHVEPPLISAPAWAVLLLFHDRYYCPASKEYPVKITTFLWGRKLLNFDGYGF